MGRPAGSKNKHPRAMREILKREFGDKFDVILMMAENCITLHNIAQDYKVKMIQEPCKEATLNAGSSARAANAELDKLAQYIEPKVSAVKVSADEDSPLVLDHVVEFIGVK